MSCHALIRRGDFGPKVHFMFSFRCWCCQEPQLTLSCCAPMFTTHTVSRGHKYAAILGSWVIFQSKISKILKFYKHVRLFQITSTEHMHMFMSTDQRVCRASRGYRFSKLAFSPHFWVFPRTGGAFNRLIANSKRHPHLSWVTICLGELDIQAPEFNICIQEADQRMEVFKSFLDCCGAHQHLRAPGGNLNPC